MGEIQYIQWFPGHMTKTKRKIQELIKIVDIVVEIIDARVPVSSRNPDLDAIINSKPRIILMNKCDIADKDETYKWISYYKKLNITALAVDCKSGKGLNAFFPAVKSVLSEKILSWRAKGMVRRTIKAMVVGIPNVGKSSFINKMSGGAKARVEDRPGVTRGNQWFSIGVGLDLLDTPGMLWPKFDDPVIGEHLAFTGAIKDQVMDIEQLAKRLLELLIIGESYEMGLKDRKLFSGGKYISLIKNRFKISSDDILGLDGEKLLVLIGKSRGMLASGGKVDTERAATMILDEFRGGKLGRITLEKVQND